MIRTRLLLLLLFVCIATSSAYLLVRSYHHLRSEEELARREASALLAEQLIQRLRADLATEDRRPFSDYRFLTVVKKDSIEVLVPSPLAQFPVQSNFAGLIGHFQIESDGRLRSPLLPEGRLKKLDVPNRAARNAVRQQLEELVKERKLFQYGSVERIAWRDPEANTQASNTALARKERTTEKQGLVFDVENSKNRLALQPEVQEIEIHPFRMTLLEGHIVFHRLVLRMGERLIQGFVVQTDTYLSQVLQSQASQRFPEGRAFVVLENPQGAVLSRWGKGDPAQKSLWSGLLASPGETLRLTVRHPQGDWPQGSEPLLWVGCILILVAGGGLFAVDRVLTLSHRMAHRHQEFISAVSHELKTPLSGILMNTEMLQEGMVSTEERRQNCYRRIRAEGERLSRLVHNILDLTQLEQNRWNIRLEKLNLDEVLREHLKTMEPFIALNQFEIKISLTDSQRTYSLDRDAFKQIISNLIENSIKFSKDHKPKRIHISSHVRAAGTEIIFRDYGPGVPQEDIKRIFDTFYRLERELVRRTSGTGIGLSLVRHFCQNMGIELDARNAHPGLSIHLFFKDPEL
jgi:two-component system phosphate regulon sensor histidine kinase PhoR